jgi:hypothetical protein
LKLDSWTGSDGKERHGLSVMSWHCRLAAIGRNRPKRESISVAGGAAGDDRQRRVRGIADADLDDPVPF